MGTKWKQKGNKIGNKQEQTGNTQKREKMGTSGTKWEKQEQKQKKEGTKSEFTTVMENLKINKSEGYDCISNEMIEDSSEIILNLIDRFMILGLEKSLVPNSQNLELTTLYTKK